MLAENKNHATNLLRERFSALWSRNCVNASPTDIAIVWRAIELNYVAAGRRYHNLRHLEHCLTEFDAAAREIAHPDQVETAIWFHDVIYVPNASDNEAGFQLPASGLRRCDQSRQNARRPRSGDRLSANLFYRHVSLQTEVWQHLLDHARGRSQAKVKISGQTLIGAYRLTRRHRWPSAKICLILKQVLRCAPQRNKT